MTLHQRQCPKTVEFGCEVPISDSSNHVAVHAIALSNPICQVADLKRTQWTYYSHCDVLKSDGSVHSHCEVNSKISGSVFACQEAPNCGHYWIHPDGSKVKDNDYPSCGNPSGYPTKSGSGVNWHDNISDGLTAGAGIGTAAGATAGLGGRF